MVNSLSELINNCCIKYNKLEALKVDGEVLSYFELNNSALIIASFLKNLGVTNETICIVGQRTKYVYIGLLGILYSGCNYTPLNSKTINSRILSTIIDTNSKVLIGEYSHLNYINSLLLKTLTNCDDFIFIVLDNNEIIDKNNWFNSNDLLKLTPQLNPVSSQINDLAYILFTSGSTGKAKGVKISNNNILAYLDSIKKTWNLKPGFKASQTHELSFDPSVSDIFNTWNNGGVLCVLNESEVVMPVEFIKREKLDIWSSVPTIANFLYKMGFLSQNVFPSLKISRFAGEPFPLLLAESWQRAAPNSSVENHYGPTEATIDVSRFVFDKNTTLEYSNSILPIGAPLPGNTIKIIDKNGELVLNNSIGEIVFKGQQISLGYLNDPEKTTKSFVRFLWDNSNELWYKSGDLGFINSLGNIECLGRIDSQIKIGGKRVEAGEIESYFRNQTNIKDLVVLPVKGSNNLNIYCVGFTTYEFTKNEEIEYKVNAKHFFDLIFFPKKIFYIEKFPLLISGKIDRKALANLIEDKNV